MDKSMIAKAMVITWRKFGIITDKYAFDGNNITYWISVPEHSHIKNAQGEEMAGRTLANRFKEALIDMCRSTPTSEPRFNVTVKFKIRKVEWTAEMEYKAEQAAMSELL